MEVTTVTGTKRMDELEIGDLVLVPASGNLLKYERVEMFYHREPETTARFVQINTESGKTLTLTSLHLLPFDDCDILNEAHLNIEDIDTFMRQSKFAHKATPGQCVISLTPSGTLSIDRILSINRRVSKGIYSPMTVEGSIIANGILSSCFSQLESHAVQKLAYDALVGIYNAFGYLQDAIVEPTQEIPSMLNYIHQLSRFVLPFSKY
uniref:Hedgehog n=1 Tax=Panagrolaimus davidi TaxID=227884 RepID=A0A914QBB1_9BILA